MSRRSPSDEDYDYEDAYNEDAYSGKHKVIRHYKKEDRDVEKKRKWERDSRDDLDHDYDERR